MIAPLPKSIANWLLGQRKSVRVTVTRDQIDFQEKSGDSWKHMSKSGIDEPVANRLTAKYKNHDVVLVLAKGSFLTVDIVIPEALNGHDYIENHLDEFTPLNKDQAYFDYVSNINEPQVTVVVTPQQKVDQRIEILQNKGLITRRITAEGFEESSIDLQANHVKPASEPDWLGWSLVSAGVIACVAVPHFWGQQQLTHLSQLGEYNVELEQRLEQQGNPYEQYQSLLDRANLMVSTKTESPEVVNLLSSVTQTTPDHTWIQQWIFDGSSIILYGESADTADLISRLESSSMLENVRYETALTRDVSTQKDRFKLNADISRVVN